MSEQQTPLTDREKTIVEIREALENVTPGDWYAQQRYANLWSIEVKQDGRYPITIANVTTTLLEVGIHDEHIKYNAQLFAKATKWLRFLLSELERLEREYAEERAAHNEHVTELCEKEKECRKLRKELDLLQELAVKVTVEREKERKSAQQEIERLRIEKGECQEHYSAMESMWFKAHQENERLEQERNMYKASSEVFYERLKIRDELVEQLHAQIKYYFGGDGGLAKLQDGVNKLLQERQKLIEGLLTIMDIASEDGVHWKLDRCYTTARDILKEIGVLSK